jgi:hypothetical protein
MGFRFGIAPGSGRFILLLTFIGNIKSNADYMLNLDCLKKAIWLAFVTICLTFLSMLAVAQKRQGTGERLRFAAIAQP